jgi:23S rRNA (guanosine2251-2'-O)-methyltransferase
LVGLAEESRVKVEKVDQKFLDNISRGVRHQGVIAEVKLVQQEGEHGLFNLLRTIDQPFLLILDQVQDPHNLGACLRTAECAGVNAVILPKDGAAPVNETVRRVAAGAAERLPVFYVTNLSRCLNKLQELGIWITGSADESAKTLFETDLRGNMAIVMGAEGAGLRKLTREHCDQIVSIPMSGTVSSLNVSVATGVILFEAVRQRMSAPQ